MEAKDKLIVALDYTQMTQIEMLVKQLGDLVSIYKVGLESFLNTKGEVVNYLHAQGKKVFLDLKFHDISNTVIAACKYAASLNVFMFNIHCANGSNTIKAVADMLKEQDSQSLFIGVTVLTNLAQNDIEQMFASQYQLQQLVINMASFSKANGMHGVVCSAQEAHMIKTKLGQEFITVCPGVRLTTTSTDDQVRIMTPEQAIANGADFIVVGRPITTALNPVIATQQVLQGITNALLHH